MKVSVLLICYGQEKYIQQSVESILSQKTNFEWELLIGEDASPDGTANVISQCIQNPPTNCTVRPFLRKENMGASRNLFHLIREARGEYLTVLEGDDYWLEEDRLQTLADFLDTHSEYVGRIFEDDDLARQLSENARKNASKLVDKKSNRARMQEIYDEISKA